MSGDYKVTRCSRRCHALERPLREGEWYYSVVLESGDDYLRRDYSAEAWQGPPEGTIGWWKSRIPLAGERKRVLAPKEVLIDLLSQMAEHSSQPKLRYLLALLLMRRRVVQPRRAELESVTEGAKEEQEQGVLRLEVVGSGSVIEVPICEIGRSEAAELRDELNELIHCDAED